VCLSCHRGAGRAVCPVSAESGCVGCHMPRRDSGQGFLFTDHWIRVVRERLDPPAAAHDAR
jgi:formate-dependent nitrite reductase cytochrome c552 subunit